MIRLNAFVQTTAAHCDEVKKLARQLIEKSRKDEGCISYDFFESSTRPEVFLFCETWRDQAAIDLHASAEHFVTLVGEIERLGTMKIEKFTF